jgi:prepilin-type N-terminal cleavage/methylation domain-containing protein
MTLRISDCGLQIADRLRSSVVERNLPSGRKSECGRSDAVDAPQQPARHRRGIRNPKSAIRNGQGGFTLVEVMIALAIIGVTAVVLLDQRLEVVRSAARARDLRTAWILTSQKMAELELDHTLWMGQQSQSNGDFSEIDSSFSAFYWEYQIVREPIDLSDPNEPKSDKKPKELLRLTLSVRAPGLEEPIVLEAQFPIRDKPPTPPPAAGGKPGETSLPASGAAPDTGGGGRKK